MDGFVQTGKGHGFNVIYFRIIYSTYTQVYEVVVSYLY